MPTVRVDGVEIYYEVQGQGQAILFFSETACDGEIGNFIKSLSSLKIIG